MIRSACQHDQRLKWGKHSNGKQRYKCVLCGQRFTEDDHSPLGEMRVSVESAKMVLRLLTEGSSIRAAERVTGIHRDTICKLIVHFGDACRKFTDAHMRGLPLTHLQFDEQWTYVYKKQSRLTTIEKEETSEQGDIYLWTCVGQETKLMPAFLIGKRSADNARRFMMDVASRLVSPSRTPATRMLSKLADTLRYASYRPMGFRPIPKRLNSHSAPTSSLGRFKRNT